MLNIRLSFIVGETNEFVGFSILPAALPVTMFSIGSLIACLAKGILPSIGILANPSKAPKIADAEFELFTAEPTGWKASYLATLLIDFIVIAPRTLISSLFVE